MAKALFGTTAPTAQLRMLDEIRALRERVAELEAALAEAERAAADRRELVVVEDAAGVSA